MQANRRFIVIDRPRNMLGFKHPWFRVTGLLACNRVAAGKAPERLDASTSSPAARLRVANASRQATKAFTAQASSKVTRWLCACSHVHSQRCTACNRVRRIPRTQGCSNRTGNHGCRVGQRTDLQAARGQNGRRDARSDAQFDGRLCDVDVRSEEMEKRSCMATRTFWPAHQVENSGFCVLSPMPMRFLSSNNTVQSWLTSIEPKGSSPASSASCASSTQRFRCLRSLALTITGPLGVDCSL